MLGACRPWLTTDELISALTPPRTDRSPYTSFCQKLPALLTDEQVAPLLKWASTRVMDLDSPWAGWSDASAMAQGLLDRALSGPAAEARIPAVAAWLRPYLRTYPQLAVPAPLCAPLDDPGDPHTRHLRRTLAHHLITVARDSEDAFQLAEGWDTSPPRPIHWRWESSIGREREQRTSLLDAADLAWLVELEKSLSDIQAPHAWPALQHVWAMVKTTDAGQDTAWATRHTRVWPQVFAHDFDAIPIDSPYAQQLRIRQERLQARSRPWEGQAEYIATTCALLTQAASGDDDSFVTLCINLQRDPKTGRFPNADFDSDLLSLPGTAILANGHEKQLLSAARRFVTESRPGDDSWIGTHNVPWRSWAAIFAFTALLDDGQALSTLTPSQWRTWAPTLVAFPLTSTAAQHSSPRRRLLEKCLPHAPRELETTYDALVRASYATEEAQSTLDLISTIWTPQLEARLLETLTDLTTQAHDNTTGPAGHEVLAMVLAHILEQGSAQSRAQALERFGAPLRETSPARDELLDTAYLRVFLIKTPHEIWPTAEHRLRTDPTALESVCDAFLSAGSTRAWLAELPTPALGDIARILLNHYPLTASPDTPRTSTAPSYSTTSHPEAPARPSTSCVPSQPTGPRTASCAPSYRKPSKHTGNCPGSVPPPTSWTS